MVAPLWGVPRSRRSQIECPIECPLGWQGVKKAEYRPDLQHSRPCRVPILSSPIGRSMADRTPTLACQARANPHFPVHQPPPKFNVYPLCVVYAALPVVVIECLFEDHRSAASRVWLGRRSGHGRLWPVRHRRTRPLDARSPPLRCRSNAPPWRRDQRPACARARGISR